MSTQKISNHLFSEIFGGVKMYEEWPEYDNWFDYDEIDEEGDNKSSKNYEHKYIKKKEKEKTIQRKKQRRIKYQ